MPPASPPTPLTPPSPQKPEAAPGVFASADPRRWRLALIGLFVVALAASGWWIWSQVKRGQATDRWARLASVLGARVDDLDLGPNSLDVIARDETIRRLEEFIAKEPADAPSTLHAHAMIANLQAKNLLTPTPAGKADERTKRYDSAISHWKVVRDSGVELPLTANRFRPADAARSVDLLLRKIEANKAWEQKHVVQPAETDPTVTALVRTTEGDLRFTFFSRTGQAVELSKSFLERALKGAYDGTLLIERRGDSTESWVRGGELRARKGDAAPTDEARLSWVDSATPGDPFPAAITRHTVAHDAGIVTSWHKDGDEYDDPAQFLLVTSASPQLDGTHTPFGRLDAGSLPALARIAAARTRSEADAKLRLDPKNGRTADQLETPVVVVKVLIYENGALHARQATANVDESERKLETVKADALRVVPPTPPSPPPADPAMSGTEPGNK